MNKAFTFIVALAAAVLLAACHATIGSPAVPHVPGQGNASMSRVERARLWGANVVAACPDAGAGGAQCVALVRTDRQIAPGVQRNGFTAMQLEAAYDLPSATMGTGQLVAIVDAYDDPKIEHDLAIYRSHYGLPTADFAKYNQAGQAGHYPQGNVGWAREESTDVDMVSASCPNCSIALIEANTNSIPNLEAATREAVALGAHIVSNSYDCNSPCGFKKAAYDAPG